MEENEVEMLRQAVEQQTLFLGNLVQSLVMSKSLNHFDAMAMVSSVEDLTEHPSVKARWAAVKHSL